MVRNAAITGPHGKKDSYSDLCESRSEGEPREVPVQCGIERKGQEKEEEAEVMDRRRVERTNDDSKKEMGERETGRKRGEEESGRKREEGYTEYLEAMCMKTLYMT